MILNPSRILPLVLSAPILLLFGPAPLRAAITISRQGDDYLVKASHYQVHISGQTGMMEKMTIGSETVVEKTAIDLENRKFARVAVAQESPDTIVAYITAQEQNGSLVDKALRITYQAQEGQFLIKTLSTVGSVSGRGMRFDLGHDAQMVRSLDFKETVPMPVLQGRTPWLRVKFYYASGATLGLLNEGAGNPYNPNENGGVSGYQYARGGYVSNSEYTYTLIPAQGARPTLGAPAMTVVEASTPAAFFRDTMPGEPLSATIRIARKDYQKLLSRQGLRLKYIIQDTFENEVTRENVPLDLSGAADPVEVKVPLPVKKFGWYRAYFTVEDASNSLLEGEERLIFSVLKRMPNMGERFDNIFQTDYTIGLGLTREDIGGQSPAGLQKLASNLADQAKGTDVRVTYALAGPPPGVGMDPRKFGQYLFDLFSVVKDTVPALEIINEPNGNYQPREYIDTFLRPAYENIKKASPSTRVMGPVVVGIGPETARYVQDLYGLGLKNLVDELTMHPYAGNFDDGVAVESMQRMMGIISANGDAGKPIYFTEAGYGHGGWSDLPGMREMIKLLISQYAWQHAILGIDYQHNFYYFTDQMGYLDFWLRSNQLTPAAVALRTYTGLVKGQQKPYRLDFGSLEDVRAFLYSGPQKQVVALWTSSSSDTSTTTSIAFNTNAKTVQWLDCFGNPLPTIIKNGMLNLSVGTFPSYLVIPPGAKLTAVPQHWGTNVALASLGAVAESTSEEGTQPAVSAIDGSIATASCWRSLAPNELPQSLAITLSGPTIINRVGIWSYTARGYDLEARGADGKWVRLVSRRDQPYRRFRTEVFKPLLTDQVRLTILDSYSGRAEVAEFQVFSPGASSGKATDLVNCALASNGAKARASSEMTKEISVAQQDWGAKQPRILKIHVDTKPENAIDGKRLVNDWRDFYPTTWMAAPGAALPQWLEIDFNAPRIITSAAVYTIAFASWSPADSGIRDWDVQVWDGAGWKTVDTITGNTRVSRVSRFKKPIKTERIRILVRATNDPEGTVGIMEVEAFGPRK